MATVHMAASTVMAKIENENIVLSLRREISQCAWGWETHQIAFMSTKTPLTNYDLPFGVQTSRFYFGILGEEGNELICVSAICR